MKDLKLAVESTATVAHQRYYQPSHGQMSVFVVESIQ